MITWREWVLHYYQSIASSWHDLGAIQVLNPYRTEESKRIRQAFYQSYYNDTKKRTLWLGINPGRYGAGVTGIPFSDPVTLEEECSLANTWSKRSELSAQFIFEVIRAAGGPDRFYQKVFIDSICPLGFTKGGKNFNYYDDSSFATRLQPNIESHLQQLHKRPINSRIVILGKGKNEAYLNRISHPFTEWVSLPHPRWVMQYRRTEKDKWISAYLEAIG